jgi:hypothetical protein
MTEILTIIIERGANNMATSFLVWGQKNRYPVTDGDGVFVGELPIEADETEISYDWTSPNNSTAWKFIAAAKYLDQVGIFSQLEAS